MAGIIQSIPLNRLVAHPDNPNRMSKDKFARLLRNIKRTGRYEPLIVRPCPKKNCRSCENRGTDGGRRKCFQIINGHHRRQALKELGYKTADAVVWDVNDEETDIMLATLNRLTGSDVLDKKLTLLKRLTDSSKTAELAKLLPQTENQIKRLAGFSISDCRKAIENNKSQPLNPIVFFLNDAQQTVIEKALSAATGKIEQNQPKAVRNAAALAYVARNFISLQDSQENKLAEFVKEDDEITVDK
ncbi:MAG: ParB-like nuclease domain-containing protein [Sedimentisphaerales bacterium]|nr:ParB-like nuclease domain-containing protein [Sedimentisphaerales bacterium]